MENKKVIRITEEGLNKIIKESVHRILSEADRHRKGYWKERWAKQKAEKSAKDKSDTGKNKDRHRKGYYHDYNKLHPERLNSGFTKGYKNGNVSDGPINKKDNIKDRVWLDPDTYIIGYDELGRPITNHPMSDLLRNKEMEWHDDDWNEGSFDD